MAKTTSFTVRGFGRFPVDMLRYDYAYPASGEDASKIDESFPSIGERFGAQGPQEIRLTTTTKGPTVERWLSFGWNIIEINGKDVTLAGSGKAR